MDKKMVYRALTTLLCTLVFVSIASAHEVTIGQRAKIGNGPELQPGTYRVDVVKNQDSAEVRFFQAGDLVLTAQATLTNEPAKCKGTEVHSEEVNGGQTITKIWLQGSKESLVFNRAPSAKAD